MSDAFGPGQAPGGMPQGMPGGGQQGMPGGGQQPSEEQMQQAMAQMRATQVDQFVAGALQELLTAGQVKLGRNDGRLLLDLVALLNDAARGQVEEELTEQVDDALSQLRMAQVQAEREIVQAATEGHVEQSDLPRRPPALELTETERSQDDAPPAPAPDADAESGQGADEASADQPPRQSSGSSGSSRLWVPGR